MRALAITLAALVFSVNTYAQERQLQYTEKIMPFTEWVQKHPQEHKVLGLFKNYTEPKVTYIKAGVKKEDIAKLTMYTTRVRISINKQASAINLPSLITLDSIRKLDKNLKQEQINADQIMPKVAGNGPVPNFKWCTKDGKNQIALPDHEQNLSYLNNPERPWCANDGRSTCVESCFLFNAELWIAGTKLYNGQKYLSGATEAEKKDAGLAMQAEARYYSSEAEFGQSVKELTQVNTPVTGIIELNIFYVNQVLQYGKVVAVFQQHPSSAQATVVTTLSAIAIRTSTYDKVYKVTKFFTVNMAEILQGKGGKFNSDTGISAGIPKFTQNIANELANMLEK
jgi:hypothetical protein